MQNGKLLVFDMRQTLRPLESFDGLTCNPIHTVHSLLPDLTLPSGVRSLLTASSVGLCHWNFGGNEERYCYCTVFLHKLNLHPSCLFIHKVVWIWEFTIFICFKDFSLPCQVTE